MKTKKQTIKVEITIEQFEKDYLKDNPIATKAEIKKAYNKRSKK